MFQLNFIVIFILIMIVVLAFPKNTRNLVKNRAFSSSLLSMMSSVVTSNTQEKVDIMPITVLSGFLGAGKTSFLHHTLSNQKGKKFGLVVNDMATINVDAKQIRQQSFGNYDGIDTMELQDGCVCCTLAEDLIASVSKLVSMSDIKNVKYDHIVVECSGIAEPRKIRDLFQQAEDYGFELLKKIRLDTLITLVDATVFLNLFGTDEDIANNRKLAYNNDNENYNYIDGSDQRKITDLLLEQVECSDIVLINKCDLLENQSDIDLVKKVIASINPSARIYTCVKGEIVDPLSIVGSAGGLGAANWGILDEHRKLVKASEVKYVDCADETCSDPTHNHDHSHNHNSATKCADETCSDPTHNHDHSHNHNSATKCADETCSDPTHNHDHSHNHNSATKCADETCSDPTHNHDHSHNHNSATKCADETCSDPTHNHDHSHNHNSATKCADETCSDPTHNHDHSHNHHHSITTAEERFGITSFVYKRRRPFHPIRFSMFLQSLGKLSVKGVSEMAATINKGTIDQQATLIGKNNSLLNVKRALIRSKGFVWMATSGRAAYFMSHAGQYLELLILGRWWADIDKSEWPSSLESEITVDFDTNGIHGDRRQELVFIGQFGKDSNNSKKSLEDVLDSCLLTDEEMLSYDMIVKHGNDDALRDHFVPDL